MYLTEYQKVSVENFMGLWARGSLDDIPVDHATDAHNVAFARKREVLSRQGSSLVLNTHGPVVRQFIAAFNQQSLVPLHADGLGNIWRDDLNQIILSLPGLVDMDCLNMNNHVFIAPIIDTSPPNPPFSADPNRFSIRIWTADQAVPAGYLQNPSLTSPPRLAAGPAPNGLSFTLANTPINGNTGPGWYGVTISWVMDTGYVTPPAVLQLAPPQPDPTGWPTTYLTTNTSEIQLTPNPGFPPPPPGATGFIVWVTQGQQNPTSNPSSGQALAQQAPLFQYFQFPINAWVPGQTIQINFFDTDLTISASALPGNGNILNSLNFLPTGIGLGSIALAKYHGRMIIIGTTFTLEQNSNENDPNTGQPIVSATGYTDDRVWISNAGQPETFDQLTGYINVQSEFDGNVCRTAFELFSVLYICKAVGTFATQDSGGEPNDPTNPWVVNMIDGGIGAYHHAVGTISGSQPSLSFNSTGFLANRNGLFLFNGNVLRPELTWKIRAVWERMTHGAEHEIRVAVDIYNDLFYVYIPVDPTTNNGEPYILLLGDYSLGLDSQNIRWATMNFPWKVHDIMMGYYVLPSETVDDYWLRLGSDGAIYKLDGILGGPNTDNGVAIDSYYGCAPMTYDMGALNIFRFIRYRMAGAGTLMTAVADQGDYQVVQETDISPLPFIGNYKDQGIQINFTNEKMMLKFEMNATTDWFRVARVDVFGKSRWPTRPNA